MRIFINCNFSSRQGSGESPQQAKIQSINIMEGVQNLPPHLQGEFMKTLEQMQIKDSLM